MAGGGGTRLRPLSTAERPKPFLPLLPDGETLLQRTVARLRDLERDDPPASMRVVVSAAWAPLVEAQVPGVRLVVEPEGRNTAAAIALAALVGDGDPDEVMVVLPADHRIDPAGEGLFRSLLDAAARGLTGRPFDVDGPLVTLGVEVKRAATEYGYLRPDLDNGKVISGLQAYPLEAFEEKPAPDRAEALLRMPGVAWNAGIFLWRRRAIVAALERFAPGVIAGVRLGLETGDLAGAYAALPSRSIDYAGMEPAARDGLVVMAAMDVGCTDVGTWPALLEVLGAAGIEGGVVEAGTATEGSAGDLIVDRGPGGLVVREAAGGTITTDRPVALLRGARGARPIVQALLDRCAAAETHA